MMACSGHALDAKNRYAGLSIKETSCSEHDIRHLRHGFLISTPASQQHNYEFASFGFGIMIPSIGGTALEVLMGSVSLV